ncbi:MAG: DUF3500 domain-containing protein [Candidatus Rokubacteria bacterium]|nr:DUF3500 domain-containing protein [Candidatus Rokubacteria bacterium]
MFKLRNRPSTPAGTLMSPINDFLRGYKQHGEALLAQPFKGITTDGHVVPGLFPIQRTGIPTAPIKDAAEALLASLTAEQRASATFTVDADAWRRWSNIHPWVMRHGVSLDAMTPAQRDRALELLRETLSAAGYRTARDVMKLNETIREITRRDDEYGEWLYWVSIMGTPSMDQPWGWQIDGHHLIVNCFVLGDQVVMTPMFMGSEPVAADTGKYAGTRVFEAEERDGLVLARSLTDEQRGKTILRLDLPVEVFTAAFRDNLQLAYEGIRFGELSSAQQALLLRLAELYVARIRPGHAEVRMDEMERHLADTHFAWMGGVDDDSVFYYRIHSPVILVEFDHQRGIAFDNDEPSRHHIHTVIRTPNGNDYGKDLLRQHHARFDHTHGGHRHP